MEGITEMRDHRNVELVQILGVWGDHRNVGLVQTMYSQVCGGSQKRGIRETGIGAHTGFVEGSQKWGLVHTLGLWGLLGSMGSTSHSELQLKEAQNGPGMLRLILQVK